MHEGEDDPYGASDPDLAHLQSSNEWRPGTGTGIERIEAHAIGEGEYSRQPDRHRDILPRGFSFASDDIDGCYGGFTMSDWYDPADDAVVAEKAKDAWKGNDAEAESTADIAASRRAQNDLINQPQLSQMDALAIAMGWTLKAGLSSPTSRVFYYMLRHTSSSGVVAKSRKDIEAMLEASQSTFTRAISELKKESLIASTREQRLVQEFPYQFTQQALEMPEGVLE